VSGGIDIVSAGDICLRRAPSAGNAQHWAFIVVRDTQLRLALGAIYRKASDIASAIYQARGRPPHMSEDQAHRDAQDMASALVNTQEGGLYAEVKPMFLHDRTADKAGIFDALAAMERNMGAGAGQDLAVVMFSGHGDLSLGRVIALATATKNQPRNARREISVVACAEIPRALRLCRKLDSLRVKNRRRMATKSTPP
jgi:nitroreductase